MCEGFPERKRPRSEALHASNLSVVSRGGIDRKKKINQLKKSSVSSTATLSAVRNTLDDTSHCQAQPSKRPDDSTSNAAGFNAANASSTTIFLARSNGSRSRQNSLPVQAHMDTWHLYQAANQPQAYDASATENIGNRVLGSAAIPSLAPSEPSAGVQDAEEIEEAGWWSSGGAGEFVAISPGARTRRQTVVCLFPTPGTAKSRFHMPLGGKYSRGYLTITLLLADSAGRAWFI